MLTGPECFSVSRPCTGPCTEQSSVHKHSRPSKRRHYPPFAEETKVHSGPVITKTYMGIIRSK